VKIGSLFGIEITIHVSWIFVFALVAWGLGNPIGPFHTAIPDPTERVIFGTLGSGLFFASVLAHELAHSLLARARGITVKGITLFVFGGISMFEGDASDAPAETWISGIGPLTSLAIGCGFLALTNVIPDHAVAALFGYLGAANIMLAIFNILPAYPLDGGRVLHGIIWKATGDRARATAIAGNVGRAIAFVMIVAGIAEALLADIASGLWLTFIGWFLLQAGSAEISGERVATALKGHTAGELTASLELHASADMSGVRTLDLMQASRVESLPVLLGERMIGVVQLGELLARTDEELTATPVTALMTRVDTLTKIPASMPADEALKCLLRTPGAIIAVTDADGDPRTLLSNESAMRFLAGSRRSHPPEIPAP
jgi:Zn-dependent protease